MSDQDLQFRAIEFAARAHRGQFRKGTPLPYVFHPLHVAQILIELGASQQVVATAILHDVIEDTDVTAEQIAEAFGAEVGALVEAASEPDQEAPWEQRKQHTIDSVRTASTDALLVICADKLDNVRSMRRGERHTGEAFWDRFHRGRSSQAWYYQRIALALSQRADADPLLSLARRLQREVESLFAPPVEPPAAGKPVATKGKAPVSGRKSGGGRRRR